MDQNQQTYPFQLMPLPYDYSALEPYIDAETMQLHHDRHLRTYVENLNAALKDAPGYQNWTLQQLVRHAASLPPGLRTAVRHNAGGVFNHEFFFAGMSHDGNPPAGRLADDMQTNFGSFSDFYSQFKAQALGVFGSGYAWLAAEPNGRLHIVTTANQETPLHLNPLICVDVWEHAYYLKHFNLRADYIDDWFRVADFAAASRRYEGASS